jgi:hypothetical protein
MLLGFLVRFQHISKQQSESHRGRISCTMSRLQTIVIQCNHRNMRIQKNRSAYLTYNSFPVWGVAVWHLYSHGALMYIYGPRMLTFTSSHPPASSLTQTELYAQTAASTVLACVSSSLCASLTLVVYI